MQQHTGAPSEIIVQKGDIINEGQLIGAARDKLSANIHATVPGKIIDIGEYPAVNGVQSTVVIEAEGAFTTTGSSSVVNDWRKLDNNVLLEMVRDAGVVGMGSIPVPVSEKLADGLKKNVHTLIINGAESEPYLTADDMLMKTYPLEIIEGIHIVLKITGIKKAFIGIEDNKKESIKELKNTLKQTDPEGIITVKRLRTKYPQGAEKLLVYSILGITVPLHTGTSDSGIIVFNVATIYAIREAVLFNKPLIDRYITVSGSMINRPGNYKVRIGTKISDIIEECGGFNAEPFKIVMGGPMRGSAIQSMDIPVVKGTTGVLFLSEKEVGTENSDPCIRCGRCVSACPAGLIPGEIAGASEIKRFDLINRIHLSACIMCNCCSYVCPSKRPLSYLIQMARDNTQ